MIKVYEKYNKLLLLVALLVIFIIITLSIKHYFSPFFIILLYGLITKPVYNILCKLKLKKSFAGAISILIINLMIFCIIFYFGNTIVTMIIKLYRNNYGDIIELEKNIRAIFGIKINDYISKGMEFLSSNTFKSSISITGEGLIAYVIGNISVYFLLVDKEKILDTIGQIFPLEIITRAIEKKNNLKELLKIELILVGICTGIIIVGFKILGIPSSVFLGIICGILDILPYVGTIIVFIPIIIYNIIIRNYLAVVGLVALYLLSQIIKEILEMKFLSSKLDIHPLVIMLSIYIGVKVFGFIGIIAGPIYCLIAKDIIYS